MLKICGFCPAQKFCKIHTHLGGHSWLKFCQQEFGEFPRPAWAVGSYSSGPLGTPQILADKTSPMSVCLRVYNVWSKFRIYGLLTTSLNQNP